MTRKNVFYILLGATLAVAAIGYYYYNKPTESVSNLNSDYITTAKDLYQEFDTNEEEATKKYQNKVLEVSGVVDSISTNEQGSKIVILNSAGGMGAVCFELDTSILSMKSCEKGQLVTIKGICSGKLLDVILNRSVIK